MSIESREDANKYYQIVNELVDEYMAKENIRPSSLKGYLSPGSKNFKNFIQRRHEIKEIKGIERVLSDVIEDRASMESDGVLKFESFKFFESDEFKISSMRQCLYKGIEKADLSMEKALADVFDTNLGSIDVVDSDKHSFYIEDEMLDVVCFSLEDMKIIENNVVEYLYSELKKKEIDLIDIAQGGNLSINLGDFISSNDAVFNAFDEAIRKKLDDGELIAIIENLLSQEYNGSAEMKSERGYYIWSWK
jgi:hypothetical protein